MTKTKQQGQASNPACAPVAASALRVSAAARRHGLWWQHGRSGGRSTTSGGPWLRGHGAVAAAGRRDRHRGWTGAGAGTWGCPGGPGAGSVVGGWRPGGWEGEQRRAAALCQGPGGGRAGALASMPLAVSRRCISVTLCCLSSLSCLSLVCACFSLLCCFLSASHSQPVSPKNLQLLLSSLLYRNYFSGIETL
jgi:hypothetical protein